jgi:hypothetical protein
MDAGKPPIPAKCDHQNCNNCWKGYPRAQFPNWTPSQVRKSRIAEVIGRHPQKICVCRRVDIDDEGHFSDANAVDAKPGSEDETWKGILETAVSTTCSLPQSIPVSLYSVQRRRKQGPYSLKTCRVRFFRC